MSAPPRRRFTGNEKSEELRDIPLRVVIIDGMLAIEIGLNTLACVVENGPVSHEFKLLNIDKLAGGVLISPSGVGLLASSPAESGFAAAIPAELKMTVVTSLTLTVTSSTAMNVAVTARSLPVRFATRGSCARSRVSCASSSAH